MTKKLHIKNPLDLNFGDDEKQLKKVKHDLELRGSELARLSRRRSLLKENHKNFVRNALRQRQDLKNRSSKIE